MGIDKDIKGLIGLAGRQTIGFIAVLKLKIRIIGFSNKRSGIMTKLGELAFKAYEEEKPLNENEAVKKLIEEIREADNEIILAEDSIGSKKKQDLEEREEFQKKRREEAEQKEVGNQETADIEKVTKPEGEDGKASELPTEDKPAQTDAPDGGADDDIKEPGANAGDRVEEASPEKEVENKEKNESDS